jgi:transposase-like protein
LLVSITDILKGEKWSIITVNNYWEEDILSSTEGTPEGKERIFKINMKNRSTQVKPGKQKRNSKTAADKKRIIKEIDNCNERGGIGAILRREGVCSSTVVGWREQLAKGNLDKSKVHENELVNRILELERANKKLQNRLHCAETAIDIQKKISEIMNLNTE